MLSECLNPALPVIKRLTSNEKRKRWSFFKFLPENDSKWPVMIINVYRWLNVILCKVPQDRPTRKMLTMSSSGWSRYQLLTKKQKLEEGNKSKKKKKQKKEKILLCILLNYRVRYAKTSLLDYVNMVLFEQDRHFLLFLSWSTTQNRVFIKVYSHIKRVNKTLCFSKKTQIQAELAVTH